MLVMNSVQREAVLTKYLGRKWLKKNISNYGTLSTRREEKLYDINETELPTEEWSILQLFGGKSNRSITIHSQNNGIH